MTSVSYDRVLDYWILDVVRRAELGCLHESRLTVPGDQQIKKLFIRRHLAYSCGKDPAINFSPSDVRSAKKRLIEEKRLECLSGGILRLTVKGLSFLEPVEHADLARM